MRSRLKRQTCIGRAPAIAQSIEQKLRPVTRQIAAFERASGQIAQSLPLGATRSVTVAGDGLLISVARRAPSVVENGIYVTVLTIFLLACRRRYTDQLILFPKTYANRLRMARICRDVQHKVSGYLFVLAVINTGLALITALCFYLAGIGDPLLWGIAFGIMNFIPFIGPTARHPRGRDFRIRHGGHDPSRPRAAADPSRRSTRSRPIWCSRGCCRGASSSARSRSS